MLPGAVIGSTNTPNHFAYLFDFFTIYVMQDFVSDPHDECQHCGKMLAYLCTRHSIQRELVKIKFENETSKQDRTARISKTHAYSSEQTDMHIFSPSQHRTTPRGCTSSVHMPGTPPTSSKTCSWSSRTASTPAVSAQTPQCRQT